MREDVVIVILLDSSQTVISNMTGWLMVLILPFFCLTTIEQESLYCFIVLKRVPQEYREKVRRTTVRAYDCRLRLASCFLSLLSPAILGDCFSAFLSLLSSTREQHHYSFSSPSQASLSFSSSSCPSETTSDHDFKPSRTCRRSHHHASQHLTIMVF